jgi:very-short-patch-repair endonuclease
MAGLPKPVTQFRAVRNRKFRWDFAWPEHRLLVEVNGGTWIGGMHARGKGIRRDYEKANLAMLNGWQQMTFSSDQITDGKAIMLLRRFFEQQKQTEKKWEKR